MSNIMDAIRSTQNYNSCPTKQSQKKYELSVSKLDQQDLKKYLKIDIKNSIKIDNTLAPPKLFRTYRYNFIKDNNKIVFVKRCYGLWIKV